MARVLQLGWQLWLLFLALSISLTSIQGSKLDRRELPPLSSTDISKLVTAVDPLNNLDPSNPASHLSKILIPRAGMPFVVAWTNLINLDSGYNKQYPRPELYYINFKSTQLAH